MIATCEADVIAAVRFAAERDLPVAVRATGHGPVAGVDGSINRPVDAGGAFDAPTLDRLREVKKAWDPADLFHFTVGIP